MFYVQGRAIASKWVILALLELWRMTTAGSEFYRDKQDERDRQDMLWLILPIDFRTFGGLFGRSGAGKCSALSNLEM